MEGGVFHHFRNTSTADSGLHVIIALARVRRADRTVFPAATRMPADPAFGDALSA